MLVIESGAAARKDLAEVLDRPQTLLGISHHWESKLSTVSIARQSEIVQYYGLFDRSL